VGGYEVGEEEEKDESGGDPASDRGNAAEGTQPDRGRTGSRCLRIGRHAMDLGEEAGGFSQLLASLEERRVLGEGLAEFFVLLSGRLAQNGTEEEIIDRLRFVH
jgi:hypothetical protein